MSEKKLFSEFETVSSKQWKQQIQFELKGADYNETLVWESPEGIKVKPFYHTDEFENAISAIHPAQPFQIVQKIFVHAVQLSNKKALDALNRGAESIYFTIENDQIDCATLIQNLPSENIIYYFNLPFLSIDFVGKLNAVTASNGLKTKLLIDPIGQIIS